MLKYERNGHEYKLEVGDGRDELMVKAAECLGLKKDSLEYLLQYGFAQSLQDSIAGLEKRVKDEYNEKMAKLGAHESEEDDAEYQRLHDEMQLAVPSAIDGQLNKRLDAIVAGTIGVRSIGEARDPLKAIANGMVRKALSAKKLKVDKDKFAELVSKLLETNREKVQAEYDRQKAEAIDVDIEL